tara:strand:+ start:299 stop:808 length:510 start_codon:yes stop_codon:yes gene_type:complete
MYRKTYLCPNEPEVDDKSKPPDNGNKTNGSKAVTAIGIASVIHQIAIHNVDASIALASLESPSGWKNNRIKIKETGPKTSPNNLVLLIQMPLLFEKYSFIIVNILLYPRYFKFFDFMIPNPNRTHAAIKKTPPIGVTMPNILKSNCTRSFSAKVYIEKENRNTPITVQM